MRFLLCLSVLSFVSCSGRHPAGGSCKVTSDCNDGLFCSSGICGAGATLTGLPTITSVDGDGTTPTIFRSALLIRGSHFGTSPTVQLLTRTLTKVADLVLPSAAADTLITASLPGTLVAGDYTVSVTTTNGVARADVSILQGAQGAPGAAGDPTSASALAQLDARYLPIAGGPVPGLTITAPGQRKQVILPADFQPEIATTGWRRNPTFMAHDTGVGQAVTMMASARLPDGATVQSAACYYVDNSATGELLLSLLAITPGSTTGTTTLCNSIHSGVSPAGPTTEVAPLSVTAPWADPICNGAVSENQSFMLEVNVTDEAGSLMYIKRCWIVYTPSGVLP